MVIGRATRGNEEGEILLLGLSRENVRRLSNREPIVLKRATHGNGIPQGWEILICFGETEEELFAELKQSGMVTEQTEIHKDVRL
jgi:hypothetical protein